MTNLNRIFGKTLALKLYNDKGISYVQYNFLFKNLGLDDDDATIYSILTKIGTYFKMKPTPHLEINDFPDGLEMYRVVKPLTIYLHELHDEITDLDIADVYMIKLTIHTLFAYTGPLLFSKLISIYHDIKGNQRNYDDILLDLALLNKYEHSSIQVLVDDIKPKLIEIIKMKGGVSRVELEERLIINDKSKRYDDHINLRGKLVSGPPHKGGITEGDKLLNIVEGDINE